MFFSLFKSQRRKRLRTRPVPAGWRSILESNLSLFRRLPPADQEELLGHVQVFMAEKSFEGCGGLELTDEIRLTVAAQACLLLLHRKTDYYPELSTVLVYPSSYITKIERHVAGPIWESGEQHLLGHTQHRLGAVVLAWDATKRSAAKSPDGRNLVLHEFAHQLDFEDLVTDGTPVLARRADYKNWKRVMSREYMALRTSEALGRPTVLDPYGGTDPAEFFAVVTETFFEWPREMRTAHPELYEELKRFYCQDPARDFVQPSSQETTDLPSL